MIEVEIIKLLEQTHVDHPDTCCNDQCDKNIEQNGEESKTKHCFKGKVMNAVSQ